MNEDGITRRDFVRQAAGAVAGAALGGALASGAEGPAAAKPAAEAGKVLNHNPRMGYRRLGKTGVMISEVGLGGHWKTPTGGRYWGHFADDKVPPDVQKARNEVWVKCAECGINYLDITTPGEATIYGNCMKQTGVKMHVGYSDYKLCMRGKSNRTVEKLMFEIDEGLRRLQVEQVWLWRPQALMGGGHTEPEMLNVLETYEKAKQAGKVKYLGMSAHSHKFVQWVLEKWGEKYHAFVFLYTVSNEPKQSQSMFDVIRAKDVGAIGLKPFHGNGYFRAEVAAAQKEKREPDLNGVALAGLRKILQVPELTASIPGMTLPAEVENNVKASYERKTKLSRAERDRVEAVAAASLEQLPPEYAWIREQGRYV